MALKLSTGLRNFLACGKGRGRDVMERGTLVQMQLIIGNRVGEV